MFLSFNGKGKGYQHRCDTCKNIFTKNQKCHHLWDLRKNGNREDNRPENLQLMVGAHPVGISIRDAVAWAREILSRYEATLETEPLFAEAKINGA